MINIIQTFIDPPGEQNLYVLSYIIIIEIEIDKPPNLNHQPPSQPLPQPPPQPPPKDLYTSIPHSSSTTIHTNRKIYSTSFVKQRSLRVYFVDDTVPLCDSL